MQNQRIYIFNYILIIYSATIKNTESGHWDSIASNTSFLVSCYKILAITTLKKYML